MLTSEGGERGDHRHHRDQSLSLSDREKDVMGDRFSVESVGVAIGRNSRSRFVAVKLEVGD